MLQVRKDPLKAAEYFRRATEAAPNFAPALEAYGHFLHKCSRLALSPEPRALPCPKPLHLRPLFYLALLRSNPIQPRRLAPFARFAVRRLVPS